MFTTTVYSTQTSGSRRRILATETDATGNTTRTVVTLDDTTATAVGQHLNELVSMRRPYLWVAASNASGQVCFIRRNVMAAVLTGTTPVGSAIVEPLVEALAGVSDAERRAVADEVGRVFDGTEDILVPAQVVGENSETQFLCLANDFLETADDDDLIELVEDSGDGAVLYEGLLAHLRVAQPDIEDACEVEWVSVTIDADATAAWVRKHRPHLTAQLDEQDANL